MLKYYKELRKFTTFIERFEYLKIGGILGRSTFGFDRYLNQILYNSKEWEQFRNYIIVRDNGCDLGILDREIIKGRLIHHINPITVDDVKNHHPCILDPNNAITTILNTHNALHYGDASLLIRLPQERKKGDTRLWTVS